MESKRAAPREQEPVTVVFRKWKDHKPGSLGDGVIALFPGLPWNRSGTQVTSYEHHGQHNGADYDGVIQRTRAATAEEYVSLKAELEAQPFRYNLAVRLRRSGRQGKR